MTIFHDAKIEKQGKEDKAIQVKLGPKCTTQRTI